MDAPIYTNEAGTKQTSIAHPNGKGVFCDHCGDGFRSRDEVREMPDAVLNPYPETLYLCQPCAECLAQEQEEDHETGREPALENGWNHYGAGWSV